MQRACGSVVVFAIVVFGACAAPAPETPPLGGLVSSAFFFLTNSQGQKELKLSNNQVKKIEELKAENRQAQAGLRDLNVGDRRKKREDLNKANMAALAKILTQKQLRRAEQIYLQQIGPALAFRKPQVAAALKITDEQKEKIDVARGKANEELRAIMAQEQRTRQQLTDCFKKRDEEILKVLTPVQTTRWKELLGEPFKLEPRRSEEQKQSGQGSDRPALTK
jgi:hypothetical protein